MSGWMRYPPPQPPAEAKPVGELIEDGAEAEEGGHFIHFFVGPHRMLEGTKVYASPPPSAPVGVEVASLPALWRLREDNGEEHTEYDKGFETASDECARMLEQALAQQPAAVDEALVERAWEAAMEIKHNKEPWFPMTKRRMKRALSAALAGQQPAAVDRFKPQEGEPPTWFEEWFIAKLDTGERVVLRRLPEEWTYDYTTADQTYYKARRLKWWMQFPDSAFVPLESKAQQGDTK